MINETDRVTMSEVDWDLVATGRSAQIDYERQLQVNADRSDIFYAIRADNVDITTTASKLGDETSILVLGKRFVNSSGRDFRVRLLFKDLNSKRVPVLRPGTLTLDLVEVFFDIQHLPAVLAQLAMPASYVVVSRIGALDVRPTVQTPHFVSP